MSFLCVSVCFKVSLEGSMIRLTFVCFNMFAMNVVSLLGLCGLSTDFKLWQRAKVCAPRADPCVASLVAKVLR